MSPYRCGSISTTSHSAMAACFIKAVMNPSVRYRIGQCARYNRSRLNGLPAPSSGIRVTSRSGPGLSVWRERKAKTRQPESYRPTTEMAETVDRTSLI